jgi:hypothetical protein
MMVGAVIISAGLGIGMAGRKFASHIGDLLSDSKIYSDRAYLNKQISIDHNFRLYFQMFGAPMPFEKRIIPAWMNFDEQQVSNYRQYTRIEFFKPEGSRTTTEYRAQNSFVKAFYQAFDNYSLEYNNIKRPSKQRFPSDSGLNTAVETFKQPEQEEQQEV